MIDTKTPVSFRRKTSSSSFLLRPGGGDSSVMHDIRGGDQECGMKGSVDIRYMIDIRVKGGNGNEA